jgi:hypothetical protein
MRTRKSRSRSNAIIGPEDVEADFDQACIEHLATVAKLPAGADMRAFGDGIREAARAFAEDVRTATNNELHDEIAALYLAAEREKHDIVAGCLEKLSPRGRELLTERAERIGHRNSRRSKGGRQRKVTVTGRRGQSISRASSVATSIAVPTPSDLRDETSRDEACGAIMRLCAFGSTFAAGRLRSSGKRSRPVWKPLLYAPEPRRNFEKRKAERVFVMSLRIAWMKAVGSEPARTARHAQDFRRPDVGPFARLVGECLRLVGAIGVDPVELINELDRRRRHMESKSAQGQKLRR